MPQLDKLLRAAWVVNFGQPFLLKIWTWDMDGYRHSPDTKPFDKVFFSWNMSRGFIPYHTCVYLRTLIYTWNPNVPCFDWKRPSFGGKTKDKWVPGIYIYNTYIYILYILIYIYIHILYVWLCSFILTCCFSFFSLWSTLQWSASRLCFRLRSDWDRG